MHASRFLRSLVVLALALPCTVFAATPITGVVTNRTTDKPSAGDDVVLLKLEQGMQEAARTKTDARGRFTLDVPDDGMHLVRVTHDKANYFKPVPPGTQSIEVDVYSASPTVKGVSTEAQVWRIQSDASGNGLTVVENIFVKNDSKPPMTQFSAEPFDFYLPDGAVVSGSAALAPGGMPVQAAPVPLKDKGHYTFLFPIRPGETRFQISYKLPYSGSFSFNPHLTGATDTVAIMLPKSMKFAPDPKAPYSPVNDDVNAQTFVARNVGPDAALAFVLSGSGQLPRDSDTPDQGAGQPGAAGAAAGVDSGQVQPATEDTRPGKGLGLPLDPEGNRDPWGKYKWWILSGLAVVLALAAAFLLRKPAAGEAAVAAGSPAAVPARAGFANAAPVSAGSHAQQLLQVLKEEMFALETERLQGKVSESDYAAQKAALELILRRALGREVAG